MLKKFIKRFLSVEKFRFLVDDFIELLFFCFNYFKHQDLIFENNKWECNRVGLASHQKHFN